VGPSSLIGMVVALTLGQAFLFVRLALWVWPLGGQMALYEELPAA